VLDGVKALRKAVRAVFGEVPVHRCIRHKERNVLDERDRPAIKARLRPAWAETDHARALEQLRALAGELDRSHPGAGASLREGMEETLTPIARSRLNRGASGAAQGSPSRRHPPLTPRPDSARTSGGRDVRVVQLIATRRVPALATAFG
jgi:hypothetical protein